MPACRGPSERTSRDYVETIQVADDLAGTLPDEDAAPLRKTIAGLRVSVFIVRSVVELYWGGRDVSLKARLRL